MKKQVVVLLADTPQKRDGRSSPEQVNSSVGDISEALLFHLVCAQETKRGELYATGYVVLFQRELPEVTSGSYACGREGFGEDLES
jgi:hypothetical protein